MAWFAIHTVRVSDQRETIVHRRYRDFASTNEELRAAYKGSHLLSSFPVMPGRSWKLWEVRGDLEGWCVCHSSAGTGLGGWWRVLKRRGLPIHLP